MASPWLLGDYTGSGRPIRIGAPLSNRPGQLGPYHMDGCQGRVAHHYWALMTNITERVKVKASGGVRTFEACVEIDKASAERVGT